MGTSQRLAGARQLYLLSPATDVTMGGGGHQSRWIQSLFSPQQAPSVLRDLVLCTVKQA